MSFSQLAKFINEILITYLTIVGVMKAEIVPHTNGIEDIDWRWILAGLRIVDATPVSVNWNTVECLGLWLPGV